MYMLKLLLFSVLLNYNSIFMFLVALHIHLFVWFSLSTQDVFAIDMG
jgi:hypothetical protein